MTFQFNTRETQATHRRFTVPIGENQVEDFLLAIKRSQDISEEPETPGIRNTLAKVFHSKAFHIAVVVLCCFDGLLVLCMLLMEIEVLKLKPGELRTKLVVVQFAFECISVSIVSLFLVEILFKLWLFGLKFYGRHWLEVIDATVCVVSFAVDIYNIVRHTQHAQGHTKHLDLLHHSIPEESNHTVTGSWKSTKEDEYATVQNTLADAAGLLVLFRLWRVVRIVNAIIISLATSHEGTVKKLKAHIIQAEERVRELEEIIVRYGIPLPLERSREKSS